MTSRDEKAPGPAPRAYRGGRGSRSERLLGRNFGALKAPSKAMGMPDQKSAWARRLAEKFGQVAGKAPSRSGRKFEWTPENESGVS